MDPVNAPPKFEVRSFTRSWDTVIEGSQKLLVVDPWAPYAYTPHSQKNPISLQYRLFLYMQCTGFHAVFNWNFGLGLQTCDPPI